MKNKPYDPRSFYPDHSASLVDEPIISRSSPLKETAAERVVRESAVAETTSPDSSDVRGEDHVIQKAF